MRVPSTSTERQPTTTKSSSLTTATTTRAVTTSLANSGSPMLITTATTAANAEKPATSTTLSNIDDNDSTSTSKGSPATIDDSTITIAVGVACGAVCLVILGALIIAFVRRNRRRRERANDIALQERAATMSTNTTKMGEIEIDDRRRSGPSFHSASSMPLAELQLPADSPLTVALVPGTPDPPYDDVSYVVPYLGIHQPVGPAAASPSSSFEIPLGEIVLGDKLGEGSFGVVWKGQWHGKSVAVKQVKLDANQSASADFAAELAHMASLKPHENVAIFYGIVQLSDGDPAAVVEFCANGALVDALYGEAAHAWTTEQQVRVARDAACGIAHLHRLGIVHRDIAARNVLLTKHNVGKVSDFGMARTMDGAVDEQSTLVRVGPVKWMAPEQMSRRVYSPKSDVFAFGVLLYEIFAREAPWKDVTNLVTAKLVLSGERMPVPTTAPADIGALMTHCWAIDAKKRPDMVVVQKSISLLINED